MPRPLPLRRDVAHWVRNESFFGLKDRSPGAQPYLGEERLKSYVEDLTAYIGMLRAGFPATQFVAVHTMPQRNARHALPHTVVTSLAEDRAQQASRCSGCAWSASNACVSRPHLDNLSISLKWHGSPRLSCLRKTLRFQRHFIRL